MSCLAMFPGMEVKLTSLWFPGSCLSAFMKIGVTLAFLQSSGTSPILHNFSQMMETGYVYVHIFSVPEQKLSFAVDVNISSIFFKPLLETDWLSHLKKGNLFFLPSLITPGFFSRLLSSLCFLRIENKWPLFNTPIPPTYGEASLH